LEAWWTSAAPILLDSRPASAIKSETIARNKLTGQPMKLDLDDGTSDGKRSIAGGGHARKFKSPAGGKWYVVAVSVYGSRYGPPKAPATKFDVALCDAEIKAITQWQHPYATFPYGDPQWVRIEVPPTRAPEEFAICLNFRPTATSGVFVHSDSSRSGDSQVATPGKPGKALDAGEWMIRVELDQVKEADALNR
jgi:hypothetical protein